MNIPQQIEELERKQGPEAVKGAIDKNVKSLQQAQYHKAEILETLLTFYPERYHDYIKQQLRK